MLLLLLHKVLTKRPHTNDIRDPKEYIGKHFYDQKG